ncbi:HAD family hydrolase [Devriesea agamarum]|uniref:HAD family hydrolase n=1 Tax=Devriesea agamarum TaxID=472569 RepID=UPI00071CCE59|nr:HAD family phosphatase [Devriesea agamarum]
MTVNRFAQTFGEWTPKAVVFDCDGLLLDTESVWNHTQKTVLARYGAELSPEEYKTIVGTALETSVAIIARAAQQPVERVHEELEAEFKAALARDLRVLPGAREVVEAAAARVPVAVASNSWHEALEDKLTRTGLIRHMTALESSDTVENPKPAPDMYLAGAAACGAFPKDTLAFEDSELGALAARRAGLRLIAVPSHDTQCPQADLTISSLSDPDLLEWISFW